MMITSAGTNYYWLAKKELRHAEAVLLQSAVSAVLETAEKHVLQESSPSMHLPQIDTAIELLERYHNSMCVHLGKKSYGWRYMIALHVADRFAAKSNVSNYRYYEPTLESFVAFVESGDIVAEDGSPIEHADYMQLVTSKSGQSHMQLDYCRERYGYLGIDGLEWCCNRFR